MLGSTNLTTGLVSITFRKSHPRDIVRLAKQAKLKGVEWGGDVHVPHGDIKQARVVKEMTRDAGLEVHAYGSYFRLGESEAKGLNFRSVLDTAQELAAPVIRVWAGTRASTPPDSQYRNSIIEEARRVASQAAQAGIAVAFEFHGKTLADTNESAVSLLRSVNHPNIRSFWQPPNGQSKEYALTGLQAITPYLANVHVFHWAQAGDQLERRPLEDGEERWRAYIKHLRGTGKAHALCLEFAPEDSSEQLLKDAATLREWIEGGW